MYPLPGLNKGFNFEYLNLRLTTENKEEIMNKQLNVYSLLDRSGSMAFGGKWIETVGSLNGYFDLLPKSTNIFSALFDNISYDVVFNGVGYDYVKLDSNVYKPRGGTPLLDSAARIMHYILDSHKSGDKVVLVFNTDGGENESTHFKLNDITNLTNVFKQREWEIIFLGSDFSKITDQASSFNVDFHEKSFNRITPQDYTRSTQTMATSTIGYASGQAINLAETLKTKA